MPYLPEAKIEAFKLMPGAADLLDALEEENGAYLVGGAVRDMLLGFAQYDFDVCFEGDALALAGRLAERLAGAARTHERFGTATVTWGTSGEHAVDIAQTRAERYARPGALPEVSPTDLAEDLRRRDFSVNAMAVALWRERLGELFEVEDATADLAARVLRVLHDESFVDDPTRLLRLLRYGARLGFTAEPHTEDLAVAAVESGALATVSGTRIADELMDLLAERSAVVAIDSMAALGLDRALHARFEADEYVASRATMRLAEGVRQDLLLLAAGSRAMDGAELDDWLAHLGLRHGERATVRDAVTRHADVLDQAAVSETASRLDTVLRSVHPETVALAAAIPGVDHALRERLLDWLDGRRQEHLLITGADLRAAGAAEGPEIGRALADTMARAIDGELSGRDDQLRHGLEFLRREQAEA